MKIKDLREHFPNKNIDDIELNPAFVAVNQEFARHGNDTTYQERAIKALKRMHIPFTSEWNLLWELTAMLLRAKCLYCDTEMDREPHGGGNSSRYHFNFKCSKCGSKLTVTLPIDGLSFEPPPDKEVAP